MAFCQRGASAEGELVAKSEMSLQSHRTANDRVEVIGKSNQKNPKVITIFILKLPWLQEEIQKHL